MGTISLKSAYNALKSYVSGYLSTPYTTGTITAGTPVKIDLTNVTLVNTSNFEISGGSIKYTGVETVKLNGSGGLSLSASLNNTIMKIYRGKNGTVNLNSEIQRKIGTGGDLGAASMSFNGELSTNDTIDIFVDSTLGGTVTLDNIIFTIENTTL